MSIWRFVILLLGTLTILMSPSAFANELSSGSDHPASVLKARTRQKIMIVISAFSDNRNGVFWSLEMANQLQKKGSDVTVTLLAEAVRLADSRTPKQFEEPVEDLPFWKAFDEFVHSGGRVQVESTTANRLGLGQQELRDGAALTSSSTIADVILASDKVLHFGASLGD